MTAHHTFTAAPAHLGADWRIVTRMFGGLLGTEYLICADEKYYRVGELAIQLLKRGTPLEEIDLLEVDPDGEPVEYPEQDRACSASDRRYQTTREA